jgi:chromosome segregation ATPase
VRLVLDQAKVSGDISAVQALQTPLRALADIVSTLTRQHAEALLLAREASNQGRDVLEFATPLARQVQEAQTRGSDLQRRIHEAERNLVRWRGELPDAQAVAETLRRELVEP